MPELRTAIGVYHGVIERARYDNGVMWAKVWIPAWSTPVLKYVTPWAKVSIPWGAFNYGMWGSLHRGEHVWVAFEHGDPELPVVLGYIPMPQVVNEQGKLVTKMPPEFVNDDYADKSPHTGKRDDPPGDNPPINPAWIAATPLYHQYFLLHDKLRKVVMRVADTPTLAVGEREESVEVEEGGEGGEPVSSEAPKASLNLGNVVDLPSLIKEAVRVLGIDKAVEFVKDILNKAAEAPGLLANMTDKLVNNAIDIGIGLLKDATGIDVSGVVETLGDLIEQATNLLGGGE
ncbi:MAG: phage baseplate assembly protein V [Candidatus Thermoplasmatota archaeon]|nr:phage baseplate assembly protein V [Candidatus Thermoplasmatota archaeon]